MSVRVLIVDDQELIRSAFRVLLESTEDIDVVGEAGDGEAALRTLEEQDVDVVLMDIRMPGMDGIEATRRIAEKYLDGSPHVLMLTTFGSDDYVFESLRAGASGFLLKDAGRERLFDAIHVVAEGNGLLDPAVTRSLIAEFAGRTGAAQPESDRVSSLSAREREVLILVAEGLSNTEIAATLFISVSTVKKHVSNTMLKLNARDRAQLVVFAYQAGLDKARR